MLRKLLFTFAALTLAASSVWADFSYQETSTITGGAMMSMMNVAGIFSKKAKEPTVSHVYVKGNRMVHRSAQSASIIDLDAQTITSVDFQKKQYSVMTFTEMKQLMDSLAEKSKEGQAKFTVSAKNTGKTRQIAGATAKELLVTMQMEASDAKSGQKGSMTITCDMWLAPGVAGYAEVRDFQKRMAAKLSWTPSGNMFMSQPNVAKGMDAVYKEMASQDGLPVLNIISMGGAGMPEGGEGQAAQSQQRPAQQQQQAEKPSIGGALGGALGSRFGLGRKKTSTNDQPQDQPAQSNAPAASSGAPSGSGGASGSLIEMQTEMSGFSSAPVPSSEIEVPAGFKKVEADTKRLSR